MTGAIYAPQHKPQIEACGQAYVIEGVLYSPLKMTFKCNYDGDTRVYCKSCEWDATLDDLPEDAGHVQPDLCPACAKDGDLGWVRCEPPADAAPEPPTP